jgi:hypothetical protein
VKKIERSNSINSADSILIKFTYLSTSSRFVIVLTIMTLSFQSSSFLKIKLIFEIVELMIKDIFDIVLIRRLMRQQRINEAKRIKDETMIQSINKRFWIIEKSNACRAHNCRILLTDERMNCYCCLSKMNEKFSSLYKKSFSFIYLLIFIFWFIEIHLKIEIFVCHESFFFWSRHFRSSLSFRFDFIRIAYSFSNSLILRQSRKSVNLKEIISIEWL